MAAVDLSKLKTRKRVKLIIGRNSSGVRLGRNARLVDAETGEDIPGIRGMVLNLPLNSIATVTAEILVDEIEVEPKGKE